MPGAAWRSVSRACSSAADAARRNVEVAAFGRERLGDRKTDALARPGDERALALQLQVHRIVLVPGASDQQGICDFCPMSFDTIRR